MKLYCFNDQFSGLPEAFVGRELPKFSGIYHISYMLKDNDNEYVELKEIPSLMFDYRKHFIPLHEPIKL